MEWVLGGIALFILLIVLGAARRTEEDSTIWKPKEEE